MATDATLDKALLAQIPLEWERVFPSDYERLIHFRAWFNQQFPTFELYLEDVWNEYAEGETWLAYILRSLTTLNETEPLAFDKYTNARDAKGVWHLGDYYETEITLRDLNTLVRFMQENV
jgi:hypothetical protein